MTFPRLAVLCALSPWTLPAATFGATGLPDSDSPAIVHHSNVQAFRTPFFFERNKGQYAPEVKFYHRSRDYSFFLTATEMVTVFRRDKGQTGPSDPLKIKFLGTQPWARTVGEESLESRSHYFLGDRPDRWVTGVEHFRRVRIANLYPGIDAVFYGRQGSIEYDLEVRPGADPNLIRLQVESPEGILLDGRGRLLARLREGQVVHGAPFIYQGTRTRPEPVGGTYRLLDSRVFGFEVAQYDPSLTLVIDPLVLVYSTYLGGTERDDGHAITVDDEGNAYTAGQTASDDFPREGSPNDPVSGTFDVFVSKFSSDGGSLIFSTILGGTGADTGADIALGPAGSVFVAGSASVNFPTTPGAFDTERSGASDGFVVRLNSDGSQLLYSTYLGGSRNENTWGLAVDADGSAYVVGDTTSDDFPTASFQETFAGNVDGFLTKLTPDGTGIVYSTYLGGSAGGAVGRDKATDVAVDDQNCAYVVGVTGSDDFPLTPGVFQTQLDVADGFVAKFAADGQSQIYSTLIGGNNIDFANGIAIDRQGNAYVTGALSSGANVTFPTRNLIQDAPAGLTDSFVAKLNSDGSDLVYSTYLGAVPSIGRPRLQ